MIFDALEAEVKPPKSLLAEYQSVIGSLQWLISARPEISYAVNTLARATHVCTEQLLREAKRVLQYLYASKSLGIAYKTNCQEPLTAFADASFLEEKSITGYACMLGHATISFK